jgi:DNA-binding NtrC family response regulator
MDVLLTFAGFHDPYTKGLVGDEQMAGPIMSLLAARSFDRVVLFGTPAAVRHAGDTKSAIKGKYPACSVENRETSLSDPTDYAAILTQLREHLGEVLCSYPAARFFVSVASGTPQMHACWLQLILNGELPGMILHVRPPQFVSKAAPAVSEVPLSDIPFAPPLAYALEWETAMDMPNRVPGVTPYQRAPVRRRAVDVARGIGLIGSHPAFQRVLEAAECLAENRCPVLLTGETGTGKELIARLIHLLGRESEGPFVPINCAAIPEQLVESYLFGHKKGAFTDAKSDMPGKFDAADGGVLFLDELGELPLATQSKLLRVLQDKKVEPVGASEPHLVNVRVMAATNAELKEAIEAGRFRRDLYFRLNVGELHLPALRERRSDITALTLSVLERVNRTVRQPRGISDEALRRLEAQDWPGNIRELENVIERSVIHCRGDRLEPENLIFSDCFRSESEASLPEPHEGFSLEGYLSEVRKRLLCRALELSNGNQSRAARLLGMTPQAVNKARKSL